MAKDTIVNTGKPIGAYEQLTVAAVAVGLAEIPKGANRVVILPKTAETRWKDDGGTPTSSEGMPLAIGQPLELNDARSIINFKAIRTGATSAEYNISYYFKE